ncbi:MAG: MFS transporter [Elusimicrobia bacterium]|nr:MFS transporter [Elusimicrobiota bacterium]
MLSKTESRNPWLFVPSVYFAEGLPYILINSVSVILYKNMGVSNAKIAFWTSWLYLPWVIKMLWGPMVDMYGTRRSWVVYTQLIMACCLGASALSLAGQHFFAVSLVSFAVGAFISATHDIAVDGFYMLALTKEDQAFFVGIRSMFYRFAMIFGTGFLVFRAGKMQEAGDTPAAGWGTMLTISAAFFLALFIYHKFALPYPAEDVSKAKAEPGPLLRSVLTLVLYLAAAGAIIWIFDHLSGVGQKFASAAFLAAALVFACRRYFFGRLKAKMAEEGNSFNEAFISYFTQDGIGYIVAFILFYRLAEAMLLKMTQPFLLDAAEKGGLGIATAEVGIIYGTIGMTALITGGLLGGWLISKYGFRRCLWPMVLALHVPDVFYLYMAYAQSKLDYIMINLSEYQSALSLIPAIGRYLVKFAQGSLQIPFGTIPLLVAAEQFGYGIGLTAFTVYLMMICKGKFKTAHFAISTGIMALGMMAPGMISGLLQQRYGYQRFFLIICILTIPGILVIFRLPINEGIESRQ